VKMTEEIQRNANKSIRMQNNSHAKIEYQSNEGAEINIQNNASMIIKSRLGAIIKSRQDNTNAVIEDWQDNTGAIIKGGQDNTHATIKNRIYIYNLKHGGAKLQKLLDEFSRVHEFSEASFENFVFWCMAKGE